MKDIFDNKNFDEKDDFLEVMIKDAIFRIRRDYDRTDGKIFLAFSGGKDSTVLAHLIMMADLPTHIPFVYSDTGIELDAIKKFVNNFPYDNIIKVKPRKPFAQVLKDYGKPCISKLKSECLSTYQKHIDDPFSTARCRQMITGIRERAGVLMPESRNSTKLANKHMHFLHPDTEFKIANKCCQHLKKIPFQDFEKENDMRGSFSGVRTAEGGVRSIQYSSCVNIKHKNGKEYYQSMPIIDWTDEMVDLFIKKYDIEISEAYTVYGCKRTGCSACPFSKNVKQDLKVLWDYEPLKYKAMMKWLKDVYMYQEIECDWDEEYTKEYNERKPIIEQRRQEMMDKFRPEQKNKR